jgi:hypothetical protein
MPFAAGDSESEDEYEMIKEFEEEDTQSPLEMEEPETRNESRVEEIPEEPPVPKPKTSVMVESTGMGESISKRGRKKDILSQSAWFLTIVVNKSWLPSEKETYEKYEQCLKDTLNQFWTDEHRVKEILTWGHGTKTKTYQKLNAYFTTEQAPDTTYLHAHGVVLILHYIWLRLIYRRTQINLTLLYNKNLKDAGFEPIPGSLYFHADFIEDWKSRDFEKQSLEGTQKNSHFRLLLFVFIALSFWGTFWAYIVYRLYK